MPFKKGQIANPKGRNSTKPFRDMLNVALHEPDGKKKHTKLRSIADKLISKAKEGEPWAIEMVMDRIDGKVPQTHANDEENPIPAVPGYPWI